MTDPQQTANSIVRSFNAKTMSLAEIVNSFVSPPDFQKLTASSHSLILGARGSGKTTLLKMISKKALDLWNTLDGRKWKENIDFTGIYIPADALWDSMLESIRKSCHDAKFASSLTEAVFSTNVYISITQTLHDCFSEKGSFRSLEIDRVKYEETVQKIADLWGINLISPSFLSLKHSLTMRLIEIKKIFSLLSYGMLAEEDAKIQLSKLPYWGRPLFEAVSAALDILNRQVNLPDYKWALLFDEFEIAPREILDQLLLQMRAAGNKQHILFKISLAPCGLYTQEGYSGFITPSIEHDYKQVTLWYAEKGNIQQFCHEICSRFLNTCQESAFHGKDPKEVFGEYFYTFAEEKQPSDMSKNLSPKNWQQDFIQLNSKNKSFSKFLVARKININVLDKSSKSSQGSTIRKIAPLVIFKNSFRHQHGQIAQWSRKPNTKPYAGWPVISAICEGNPRWLMGILTDMLQNIKPADRKAGRVPPSVQAKVLYHFSETFYTMLRSTPSMQFNEAIHTDTSISETIDCIGNYFKNQLLFSNFNDNPILALKVDEEIKDSQEDNLRIAINHGALVCLDQSDQFGGYKNLKGKRFRLSYLLSPFFSLIPRQGKSIYLSKIINSSIEKRTPQKKRKKSSPDLQNQSDFLDIFKEL